MATLKGEVQAFAQGPHYLAWLLDGPGNGYGSGNVGVVGVKDLRSGRVAHVPANPGSAGPWIALGLEGLALSGGRVFWEQTYFSHNTLDAQLATASVGDRQLRSVCCQEVDRSLPLDHLLPPIGDGTNVYFWEGTEDHFLGPIVRLRGLKRRRVTGPLPVPAALAAGGGRFAVASRGYDEAGSPAWSPDGQQIAYVRHDKQLWLVGADGTAPHQIAPQGHDPDWSPDGTLLAYGGPGNTVVVAHADGSDPRVVTSGSDPAWSPDGSELAVVDQGGIWLASADGQKRLLIASGSAPDWSPDGKQLVFVQGDIAVANADGSDIRTLTLGEHPAWSPNGTEIAFTSVLGSCQSDPNVETICEIHPDGSGKHALATGADGSISTSDPAWGPTPGQLLFVKVNPETGDGDAHVIRWPAQSPVTAAPASMSIVVRTASGRSVANLSSSGPVLSLAVSERIVAAIVQEPAGHAAIEIYQPQRRKMALAGSFESEISTNGKLLVFQMGNRIETLDARRGSLASVAAINDTATGLSIIGNRIAWAEVGSHRTLIRVLSIKP